MRLKMSIIQAAIAKVETVPVLVAVTRVIQAEVQVMTVTVNLIIVKMNKNRARNQAIQICKIQLKRLVKR